ncbi:MAG: VCBS repeat-containing protein [Bacteroidia bacterium]
MNRAYSYVFLLLCGLILTWGGCLNSPEEQPAALFTTWCGSCHSVPDPGMLPRDIWEEKVLPEMAARLGIKTEGFNPIAKATIAESFTIQMMGVYPEKPLIAQEDWDKIRDFVLTHAPDSLGEIPGAGQRAQRLEQFTPVPVSFDGKPAAYLTYLEFADSISTIFTGDVFGQVFQWKHPARPELLHMAELPVTNYAQLGKESFITQIGIMQPTDQVKGRMNISRPDERTQILDSLSRPVHTLAEDIDGDGKTELFVSEYGNYAGKLTLLTHSGKTYHRKVLYPKAGVIRSIAADMNHDGKKDIVFLAAQGDEGVFILYQEENLHFRLENVLRFSPVYGSSWFELIDYEGDGDLDIVTANGDNADFSVTPKPYHGIRIFINDGENAFLEKYFFPMYGATRVLVRDFDGDGDQDIAAVSFFPEPAKAVGENFIYLKNENTEAFTFSPFTIDATQTGRWLVMDAGDYDQDGDIDIILGSFYSIPASNVPQVSGGLQTEIPDLLVLENLQTGEKKSVSVQ